jgi:Ca2+-binding EF-hand superfamily protein
LPAGTLPAAIPPVDAKSVPRKPSRFLTARERLPKGLPDWFLEKDVNGDGQITMAEFTDTWTAEKVAEFDRYDLNHDGIITAAECLKVEKAKAGSK